MYGARPWMVWPTFHPSQTFFNIAQPFNLQECVCVSLSFGGKEQAMEGGVSECEMGLG